MVFGVATRGSHSGDCLNIRIIPSCLPELDSLDLLTICTRDINIHWELLDD